MESVPVNPSRRLAGFLADAGRPFVWLFAAIGAVLVAAPQQWADLVDAPVRPSGAVKCGVDPGESLLDDPAGAWHPRMLSVQVLGNPLPANWIRLFENGEDVPTAEVAGLAFAFLDGRPWFYDESAVQEPITGLIVGRTAVGSREFAESVSRYDEGFDTDSFSALLGSPHRSFGFAVSLWPLLAFTGLIAAGRWWFQPRPLNRDGRSVRSARLLRGLVRPWGWLLAGIGFWGTAFHGTPVGPADCDTFVGRGPADAPHPRVLELVVALPGRPEPWESEVFAAWSAPTAGVWGVREGDGAWFVTHLVVSLWWLVPAGVAANAATLWRRRSTDDPTK